MKLKLALFVVAVMALASCGKPQPPASPAPPAWVAKKFDVLRRIGIDPSADLVEAANYHWSWKSRREVIAGNYHCPIGSSVDVSRSIVVVRTPSSQACRGSGGDAIQTLKILPDGAAEPLGG